MKKPLFIMIILIVVSEFTSLWGQANPTYEAKLMNDFKVSANEYEFDIYVKRTGSEVFEAFGLQVALLMNDSIGNDGNLNAIYIPGTSEMNSEQIPSDPNVTTVVEGLRIFKLTAKTVTNPGQGTIISNEGNGTRLGRFRISTTAAFFATSPANINWTFDQLTYGYATKFLTWVGNGGSPLPIDITVQENHLNKLINSPLPVELSFFTELTMGQDVILKWKTESELNTRLFEVEKRTVANYKISEWNLIGTVQASGTSTTSKEYSYKDVKLYSGKYLYRLRMIDNDGTFTYSHIAEVQIELPKEYAISQNYPNPFNTTTTIKYAIPNTSSVEIHVYNTIGQKVEEFNEGIKEAGYNDVTWHSKNLSSGVYFYSVVAKSLDGKYNFMKTLKMLLMK